MSGRTFLKILRNFKKIFEAFWENLGNIRMKNSLKKY